MLQNVLSQIFMSNSSLSIMFLAQYYVIFSPYVTERKEGWPAYPSGYVEVALCLIHLLQENICLCFKTKLNNIKKIIFVPENVIS